MQKKGGLEEGKAWTQAGATTQQQTPWRNGGVGSTMCNVAPLSCTPATLEISGPMAPLQQSSGEIVKEEISVRFQGSGTSSLNEFVVNA